MSILWDWWRTRITPPGWYNRSATLLVERECLADAMRLVDPQYRSQLVDGWEVPTLLDSTVWIRVKENP